MKNLFQNIKFDKNALLLSLFAVIVVISVPLYDKITNKYLNESLKQAAITYAVTRSINAAVSVIQESSLTIGVGVEGNLALGQALDPINDATERFSDLLTFSLWSLGSEKIIYELSKLPAFTILIIILSLINIFYTSKLLKNILLILIVLRIFMPFSASISYYFNKYYFEPNINSSVQKLKPYTKQIEKPQIKEESFWSKFSSTIESTKNSLAQIQEDAKYYISHATDIINALISLASLYLAQFLLNVILLPLLLIYLIKNFKLE
ncbi:hypothetical protein [Nautilia lithotrophica]